MYAASIRKMCRIIPSAQVISTPSHPACTRGLKSVLMHWWNSRYCALGRVLSEKQFNLATGMYPIRTVAWEEGWRCISFDIFPIVRYTGHACLSPPNCDSAVLSDARITGASTAPSGSFSWIEKVCKIGFVPFWASYLHFPPPVPSPHLIKDSIFTLLIREDFLAAV